MEIIFITFKFYRKGNWFLSINITFQMQFQDFFVSKGYICIMHSSRITIREQQCLKGGLFYIITTYIKLCIEKINEVNWRIIFL
jgi:hypothetical protein